MTPSLKISPVPSHGLVVDTFSNDDTQLSSLCLTSVDDVPSFFMKS